MSTSRDCLWIKTFSTICTQQANQDAGRCKLSNALVHKTSALISTHSFLHRLEQIWILSSSFVRAPSEDTHYFTRTVWVSVKKHQGETARADAATACAALVGTGGARAVLPADASSKPVVVTGAEITAVVQHSSEDASHESRGRSA